MQKRDLDAERLLRYDQVVHEVASRDSFDVSEVKEACGNFTPQLVSRIIKELQNDGHIAHDGVAGDKKSFRWKTERQAFAFQEWTRSKVYGNRVKLAPLDDRPRERLIRNGVASLRLADLLAILIRSGNFKESAVQAGEKLAARFSGDLVKLMDARRGDLHEISAVVGDTAFCQIMAGIELGRRLTAAQSDRAVPLRIQSSQDARSYCEQQFSRLANDAKHEEFHIVLLNTRHEPVGTHCVSSGTLDASLVHPREVFRPAIKEAAKAIILVHNHPSGDPAPGEQDIRVTRRLNEVAKLMGIDVLDHIIVAHRGTFSLRDAGLGFD